MIPDADRRALESIVAQLEAAWNAADGDAFAAPFAADADFVNIRAEHFRGRETIARGHDAIFRTIYAGSVNRCTMKAARLLRDGIGLVHVQAELDVPAGPLKGSHTALFTMVVEQNEGRWEIAAFHNTLAPPGTRENGDRS